MYKEKDFLNDKPINLPAGKYKAIYGGWLMSIQLGEQFEPRLNVKTNIGVKCQGVGIIIEVNKDGFFKKIESDNYRMASRKDIERVGEIYERENANNNNLKINMNETTEQPKTPETTKSEISGKNANNFIRVHAIIGLLMFIVAIWLIVKYELGFWAGLGTLAATSIVGSGIGFAIAPSPISNDQKLKTV